MREVKIQNLDIYHDQAVRKVLKDNFESLLDDEMAAIQKYRGQLADLNFSLNLSSVVEWRSCSDSDPKSGKVTLKEIGKEWPPPPPKELLEATEDEFPDSGVRMDIPDISKEALDKVLAYVKAASLILSKAHYIQKPLDQMAVVEVARQIESIESDLEIERYKLPTDFEKFIMSIEKDDLEKLAELLAPMIVQGGS
jgi:hypothetical protein